MTVKLTDGTPVTKAGLDTTAYTADDPQFTVNTDLWEEKLFPGSTTVNKRRLARAGDIVAQSDIDRWFPDATLTSISPDEGPTAGGAAVTITGQNLRGVTAVTFGGTAATSVVAVNESTVTCVTPAKAAGTYDVAVTDDSGSDTLTAAYTYA